MKKIIVGLMVGAALLCGCTPYSEAPVATNFPSQSQLKLQAASHWHLIAEDSAAQLMQSLPHKPPLYVLQPAKASQFEKTFSSHLIGILTSAGYPVMRAPAHPDTLTVEVSAVPLRFSEDRLQGKYAGSATVLTGGLWVLRNVYENVSPGAAMMGGALAVDAGYWLRSEYARGATPSTELVVSVSVYNGDRYLAQTNNTYYTSEDNWNLYANAVLPVKGGH